MELCSVGFHVSLMGSVERSTICSWAELREPYGAGSAFFSAVLETSPCTVTPPKADSSQEHRPTCFRAVWSQARDSLLSRSKENDLNSNTHTEAMQEVKGKEGK